VKVLKEINAIRKLGKDERDEHETLLEFYLRAMDSAEIEPVKAAA
jgi:uncharacterized protein (UPF0335 family)